MSRKNRYNYEKNHFKYIQSSQYEPHSNDDSENTFLKFAREDIKIGDECVVTDEILNFIRTNKNNKFKIKHNHWRYLSRYKNLPKEFILEFKDNVVWEHVSYYHEITEDFLDEFKQYLKWTTILERNKYFTEDMIRKYQDNVNWKYISQYQQLSEKFIIEFKDKVDWDMIATYQVMSDAFILENFDILFGKLYDNENLSQEIKNKINEFLQPLIEI